MRKGKDNAVLWNTLALIVAVGVLCAVGMIILNSAGSGKKELNGIMFQQLRFMAVAVAALLTTAFIDLKKLKRFAVPITVVAVVLLVLVLIPQIGKEVNGSRRWIDLKVAGFQPSDFAKIALVVLMSSFLHDNQRSVEKFKTGILKPILIIALFCLPIIAEPDVPCAGRACWRLWTLKIRSSKDLTSCIRQYSASARAASTVRESDRDASSSPSSPRRTPTSFSQSSAKNWDFS